jgi:hypothetical protein
MKTIQASTATAPWAWVIVGFASVAALSTAVTFLVRHELSKTPPDQPPVIAELVAPSVPDNSDLIGILDAPMALARQEEEDIRQAENKTKEKKDAIARQYKNNEEELRLAKEKAKALAKAKDDAATFTPEEFIKEYKSNQIALNERCKDKWVRLTDPAIWSIETNSLGNSYAVVSGLEDHDWKVIVFINPDLKTRWSLLKPPGKVNSITAIYIGPVGGKLRFSDGEFK